MENENVIGKVCFAILRKGFVAGLRISLELDSPGCIIGCKFDGAGIVGNTVIDDSDILLHITSHGIQTEKGHTTGDRSVFYIGVGAALKLSGRRKIENVSRAAGACAHFEPVGCLYITGCFQRKKRCCGDFRIMQRCGIAVCSAVDDDVKARYDSQKSKGKKGLVAEIDNYEVYALTWDDVFQSFDLRHAFLLDKLKMDKEAIAAEIAQTAGDEKSKDTADALTALVAN